MFLSFIATFVSCQLPVSSHKNTATSDSCHHNPVDGQSATYLLGGTLHKDLLHFLAAIHLLMVQNTLTTWNSTWRILTRLAYFFRHGLSAFGELNAFELSIALPIYTQHRVRNIRAPMPKRRLYPLQVSDVTCPFRPRRAGGLDLAYEPRVCNY